MGMGKSYGNGRTKMSLHRSVEGIRRSRWWLAKPTDPYWLTGLSCSDLISAGNLDYAELTSIKALRDNQGGYQYAGKSD